ncbi:MAG TPA: ATP-binding protein [Devosia sp.]|nr:ATP-binding protein [Devosia sp.]
MKSPSSGSITRRLIILLTVSTTLFWLAGALASSGILRQELNASSDGALVETARRLLPLTVDSLEDRQDARDVREVHHFREAHERGLAYQVRDKSDRLLLKSDDAPANSFDPSAWSGFSEVGGFRVYSLGDAQSGLTIQVAEPMARRDQALLSNTLMLLLPLLLLIPLSIAGIWLAVRRGLAPLTTLQQEISARSSANLSAIAVDGLPAELTPIAGALNHLIDRVRLALDAERQFAANSAHELRTPIAGALAQTQRLIETARDEQARADGRKIEATLRRLSDLAEKLMQLARADAGMAASEAPVEILPVLHLVLGDAALRTRPPREVRLTVAPGAEKVSARINVDALGIALRNLIDNALSHSPPNSTVEVELSAAGSVIIRNGGPAIAPEALGRLRHRFERGATRAQGSGLGLAIVDAMMKQAGGKLLLRSPAAGRSDGFEAELQLEGL